MKISDTVVVVTGGASGIGLQFVQHLSDQGAIVWSLDNDQTAIEKAQATIKSVGPQPTFVHCDVSNVQQVEAAVGEIEGKSGGVSVLVNNAAVLRDQTLVSKLGGRVKTHSTEDWQATLDNNLTGTFLMAREVASAMLAAKRSGLIVNVSSISRAGNPGQSAYAATKAAIDALTVTWSQELAPYGIRVAAIAPGFVETGMTKNIPPMFLEQIRNRTPQKRFGTLEEFGQAIQFVIENDYFNGKILELDGGLRF